MPTLAGAGYFDMLLTPEAHRVLADAGMVQGLPVEEVHRRLHVSARAEESDRRILVFYLTDMEQRGLHQVTGHASTAHYAEARLDLDRRRTGELISIGKRLLDLSEIDAAFCRQVISWSKVKLLVKVAAPENQQAWIETATRLTVRQLRDETRRVRPGEAPRKPGERGALPATRFRVNVEISALARETMELARQKLSAERGESFGDEELLVTLAEMLLESDEDGNIPGRSRVPASIYRVVLQRDEDAEDERLCLDTADGTQPIEDCCRHGGTPESDCIRCDAESDDMDRKTPSWMRERVLLRDRYRCRCCRSKRRLMAHHIRYRAAGGKTRMRNLITLCAKCHGRVHDGLLVLSGKRASKVTFRDVLGNRVNGPGPLPRPADRIELPVPQRDALLDGPAEASGPAVALDDVPRVIDGVWWARHAPLVRFVKGKGLTFTPGHPLPACEGADRSPVAAPPDGEDPSAAFRGLRGQDALIRRLATRDDGCRARGRPFPHALFTGPPGTGKTMLARGIARVCGSRFHAVTGPLMDDASQLVSLLAGLGEGDVLFVDEIHAVPRPLLEIFYDAMAEGSVSLDLHQGPLARTVRLDLPPFSLLAATTEDGDLPDALVSRFGVQELMGRYEEAALAEIVGADAAAKGFALEQGAAASLARCAQGTPREALRLLEGVLDTVAARGSREVAEWDVRTCLEDLGYDETGLGRLQRACLEALRLAGCAVPLERLARRIGTTPRNLARNVEPGLLARGLIEVTARGRVARTGPRLASA